MATRELGTVQYTHGTTPPADARDGAPPPPPLHHPAARQPMSVRVDPRVHLNVAVASLAVGGAERIVHDVISGLAPRGPSGTLFVLHDVEPSYAITGTERFPVRRFGGQERRRRLRTLALEVLASPSPLVYTHLLRVADLRELWALGVRTVPVIHNSEPGWHDTPDAYGDPHVPFVVAVCDDVAAQLARRGCPRPVMVLRHELQRWPEPDVMARDRERVRRQYGIRRDTLLIGMVGQFKSHKAYTRAVRVLHGVRRHRDARLIVLGAWDHAYGAGRIAYTAACRLALDLGVLPDLITPGSVQPIEPYYAAFDVFLNTSVYEGLSIATMEAVQHGVPVVSADVGGQREVVPSSDVLVADPADIDGYVDAIRRLTPRTAAEAPPRPPKPDLVPRLWAMLPRFGVHLTEPPRGAFDTLFITSNLNPGGAQRSLVKLLTHLPPERRSCLCVLGKVLGDDYLRDLETRAVPVFTFDQAATTLDRVESILALAERLGVRTLCFWNLDPQVKLLLAKVLALHPLQLIEVSPGPMLFTELEAEREFQRRISFDAAAYFRRLDHFVSKYAGGEPAAHYGVPPHKVSVIPNGIPAPVAARTSGASRPTPLLPPNADPRYAIVTCGRIVPNKRLEWLLDMMVPLTRRVPDATLTVVGGVDQRHVGYWERLMRHLRVTGLTNVHFVGSHADVERFLGEFRVFALSSFAQGCPNASLEAMAAGLPVVANDDGGTREQIVDGVNGFLVSGASPEEMADRVATLLEDPERAARMGRAGRRLVEERFSMDRMVRGYLEVLAPPARHNVTTPRASGSQGGPDASP